MAETVHQQLRRTAAAFEKRFGRRPEIAAAAPGRVNLIGEHTDYNDGFVMPMAIDRESVVCLAPREDKIARLASTHYPDERPVQFPVDIDGQTVKHAPIPLGDRGHWSRYLAGVIAFSYTPRGFDLLLDSQVPFGGGLSSSASIELATATALEQFGGVEFPPVTKALLAQMAEHRYGGTPCGIMDQFISAMGKAGHALLIDCRTYTPTLVPLDDETVSVLVIDSKAPHELMGGEYAERREQCERAARTLGVKALRDATLDDLDAARPRLDEVTYRRARHVIGENGRALRAADAMRTRDWETMGRLMRESHDSLRHDFEVSTPELDTLVDLAYAQAPHVLGSRMTGGGFGGCTVSLVRTAEATRVGETIAADYRRTTGKEAVVFVTRPSDGARPLRLE